MSKNTKQGRISIDREYCKGCYLCISVCPNNIISISESLNQQGYYPAEMKENTNSDKKCVACARCAIICPDIAIEVYRE